MTLTRRREGSGRNWVFLPGGPGMCGDAFDGLAESWPLPGSLWTLEYCASADTDDWKRSVYELAGRLDRMVLVGHSFGGMLLMMCEDLEARLGRAVEGWVFLDSSPNSSWLDEHWPRQKDAFPDALAEAERLESEFAKDPSEEGYRAFFLAYAPYYFEPSGLAAGKALLSRCRYDARAAAAGGALLRGYDARWVPEKPTLILAGANDRITPLACFADDRRFRRPNAETVGVPGAGHFPWVENPAAVFRALGRFENRLEARAERP